MAHTWVQLSYMPVDVEYNPESGHLDVFAHNHFSEEMANQEAKLGCWFCMVPLTIETFDTPCIPDKNVSSHLDMPEAMA
jgi:hypothetical protein